MRRLATHQGRNRDRRGHVTVGDVGGMVGFDLIELIAIVDLRGSSWTWGGGDGMGERGWGRGSGCEVWVGWVGWGVSGCSGGCRCGCRCQGRQRGCVPVCASVSQCGDGWDRLGREQLVTRVDSHHDSRAFSQSACRWVRTPMQGSEAGTIPQMEGGDGIQSALPMLGTE